MSLYLTIPSIAGRQTLLKFQCLREQFEELFFLSTRNLVYISDQDRGPTLHKSIARQDHLLMIAETRTIESRGSKQAVAGDVSIVRPPDLSPTQSHRTT